MTTGAPTSLAPAFTSPIDIANSGATSISFDLACFSNSSRWARISVGLSARRRMTSENMSVLPEPVGLTANCRVTPRSRPRMTASTNSSW